MREMMLALTDQEGRVGMNESRSSGSGSASETSLLKFYAGIHTVAFSLARIDSIYISVSLFPFLLRLVVHSEIFVDINFGNFTSLICEVRRDNIGNALHLLHLFIKHLLNKCNTILISEFSGNIFRSKRTLEIRIYLYNIFRCV